MTCPRCGKEWDVAKGPCSGCGLVVHLPDILGTTWESQKLQSREMPLTKPQDAMPMLSSDAMTPSMYMSPNHKQANDSVISAPSRHPIRPNRLIASTFTGGIKSTQASHSQLSSASSTPSGKEKHPTTLSQLKPGTLLHGGRYRLQEVIRRQDWLNGVYETMWYAYDAQRSWTQVMICELGVPESESMATQSMLRTATIALTSVGRHPNVSTLWDVFSDRDRNFFVLEPFEGESLLARLQRTGRVFSEPDVIDCCLQVIEILELLSQQSPPLVHGLIRPEHIMIGYPDSQYILTNFSLVLAGGAKQRIVGTEYSHLSPYVAPEFIKGIIDERSDLYSLMATAYHIITGSIPKDVDSSGRVLSARQRNPRISMPFEAILAKGLHVVASQRYQHISELRQALQILHSADSDRMQKNTSYSGKPMGEQALPSTQEELSPAKQALFDLLASDIESERIELEEMLSPFYGLSFLADRKKVKRVLYWSLGIISCSLLIFLLAYKFFM